MKKAIFLLAILTSLLSTPAIAQQREPIVAVSISGLLSLVNPIADEDVTVVTLLPSGVEPHHYSLRPDVVMKAMSADLIIITDHFPWEQELVDKVAREKGVAKSSISLNLLRDVNVQLLNEPGSTEPNPHAFWLWPYNAKLIAYKVAERLSELKPELRDKFFARAKRFAQDIDALVEQSRTSTFFGSKVVIAFPAEQYVAKSLGLDPVLVLVREGEVSPRSLEEARRGLSNGTLKCIIYSDVAEGFPKVLDQARALAEETGAPIYNVKVFGIGDVQDYRAIMAYNLGSLSSTSTTSPMETGLYLYLSVALGMLALAEAIAIIYLYRRFSRRWSSVR